MSPVRLRKDIAELQRQRFNSGLATTVIEFPDGEHHPQKIRVIVGMTGGIYERGNFVFMLHIPSSYPFQPPAVTSLTRVWHPNVDLASGKVHLPILDKEWRPVLSINEVVFGLQLLFLEPDMAYAANAAAADMYQRDIERFKAFVRESMGGGMFFGYSFPSHHSQCPPHAHAQSFPQPPHQHLAPQQPRPPPIANSLKRKCRYGADGAGPPIREWTPPDSDLEAMCIQDPLEETVAGSEDPGLMLMDTQDAHTDAYMTSRFGQEVPPQQGTMEGRGSMGAPREWEGLGSRKRPCFTPVPMDEGGIKAAGHGDPLGTAAAALPFAMRRGEGRPLVHMQQQSGQPQARMIFPTHAAACMSYISPPSPTQQHQPPSPLLSMPTATHGGM